MTAKKQEETVTEPRCMKDAFIELPDEASYELIKLPEPNENISNGTPNVFDGLDLV